VPQALVILSVMILQIKIHDMAATLQGSFAIKNNAVHDRRSVPEIEIADVLLNANPKPLSCSTASFRPRWLFPQALKLTAKLKSCILISIHGITCTKRSEMYELISAKKRQNTRSISVR
jgi:hypothetical protein